MAQSAFMHHQWFDTYVTSVARHCTKDEIGFQSPLETNLFRLALSSYLEAPWRRSLQLWLHFVCKCAKHINCSYLLINQKILSKLCGAQTAINQIAACRGALQWLVVDERQENPSVGSPSRPSLVLSESCLVTQTVCAQAWGISSISSVWSAQASGISSFYWKLCHFAVSGALLYDGGHMPGGGSREGSRVAPWEGVEGQVELGLWLR